MALEPIFFTRPEPKKKLSGAGAGAEEKWLGSATLFVCIVYKILTGREDVDRGEWFIMAAEASRATRSTAHDLNIRVKHGQLEVRRNLSAQWNDVLPGVIKDMRTIDGIN